tara:strand:+ start:2976 stop:3329 length:354 start_codon:yes stop_codon:yes gene_type:complete
MGRLRQRMYENYTSGNENPDARYDMAYKRVKRIKGFYVHVMVYVLVNAFIIVSNINRNFIRGEDILEFELLSTPIFWGIGLLFHGISVFGKSLFFGSNWEEKKIKELMDKDKNNKWE